MYNCIAV